MSNEIRWGILGCSWVASFALIDPAKEVSTAKILAVASRDVNKGNEYAKKHNIPRVHNSYEDLLADPEIDAVYVPLPNALHKKWTIASLRAGKHVLCEKPIASNKQEVEEMVAVARETGLMLAEGYHNLYHPFLHRFKEEVDRLSDIKDVEVEFGIKIMKSSDIRFQWELSGGATMDGSYALNMLRYIVEPRYDIKCTRAIAETDPKHHHPQIDMTMTSWFDLLPAKVSEKEEDSESVSREKSVEIRSVENYGHAKTKASLTKWIPKMSVRVVATDGSVLEATNFVMPQYYHSMKVVDGPSGETRAKERSWLGEKPSTYVLQLRAICECFAKKDYGFLPWKGPEDSIRTMDLVDSVYESSGLLRRGQKSDDDSKKDGKDEKGEKEDEEYKDGKEQ